jgi:hypothetical protein
MSDMPHDKAELLAAIQNEWQALMRVVAGLTPEQMLTPDSGGWSPKDNLAHLTEWLKALLGFHMDGKAAEEVLGIPHELADEWDFNRVNAYLFERNRDRSTEDVIDALGAKYAEVTARLESMPFEDLLQPRFADDPQGTPLLGFVLGNTSEHFKEHRETIEKIL